MSGSEADRRYQMQFFGVRKRDVVPRVRTRAPLPAHMVADAAHRASLVPLSIIARMMGDPLPGCSALEMRAAVAAPSIVHDKLDDLVFGL